MHRFPQTPEEIAKSVAELDYKFISLQTMGELRNLFPAKTYEEEVPPPFCVAVPPQHPTCGRR
jgi:hypothetical protein